MLDDWVICIRGRIKFTKHDACRSQIKKKWICMAYIPSCTQISISILQKQLPSALHTTSYQHFTALTLLPSQPSMATCKLLNSTLLTQSHPHPMRQKEPKPFLRRVRANKKGRWLGRVAEKMVLPRGVRHCTAQWSRCQLGCSCSQNFPCKFGSCNRSILSEIRVWKSQKNNISLGCLDLNTLRQIFLENAWQNWPFWSELAQF